MKVCSPVTHEDFQKYYFLRWKMLRKPWGQALGTERDELDKTSFHVMICEHDNNPIGVARLHFNDPEEAQIRYMAVDDKHQHKGVGRLMMQSLEKYALEHNAKCIILNARENAVPFYQKNEYSIVEESYILFGEIQHFKMKKELKLLDET